MNLKIYNEKVFNEYMKLDYKKMSCPLLVSTSEDYIKNLDNPILYVGQETYSWLNYNDNFSYSLDNIEKGYYDFFKNESFALNVFWNFLRESTGIEKKDFLSRIIWSNCYICGKRNDKGLTEYHESIKDLSIQYLIGLYNELKPKLTIFACGNRYEYYNVVREFISEVKRYNIDRVSREQEIINIEDIVYTYHPNNLRFSKNQKEIKQKIKSLI